MVESMMNSITAFLKADPVHVREVNMHQDGDVTYYGQTIDSSQVSTDEHVVSLI